MIALYAPQLRDFLGLGVSWGIGIVLAFAGTAIAGPRSAVEDRLLGGWGALCLLLTGWGVLVPAGLAIPAVGFVAVAVATQLTERARLRREDWRALGRMLIVSLPLWLVMAPVRPSQPDTFLNLLPNAFYLVDHGRFPGAGLPPGPSYLPGAPYNTQFLAFLGSLGWPGYPASGMSLINVMLRLIAGIAMARILTAPTRSGHSPSWGMTALGFLLVTLLDPGFVPRINFSPMGSTALAVTALAAAWLFVRNQGELAAGRAGTSPVLLSLILLAMVNAKQSGIGLVAALAGAALIAGCAERGVPRARLLRSIACAALPSVLIFLLWHAYVARTGIAELRVLPLSAWHWRTIPETLASMASVIANKGFYFGCVAIALIGLPVGFRRWGWTPSTRLLVFFAVTLVLYNGFLLMTYIAHFPGEMSSGAHSYFRYSMHLSLVMVLTLALFAREAAAAIRPTRDYRRVSGIAVIGLALMLPISFAKRLRFDLDMPQPLVWDLAAEIKPYLHDGDRLALLLPGDNGSVAKMLAGVLSYVPPRRVGLKLLDERAADVATLREVVARGYRLALVSCTPKGLPGVPSGRAVLLRDDGDSLRVLASWPYPASAMKQRWQAILSPGPLCRG